MEDEIASPVDIELSPAERLGFRRSVEKGRRTKPLSR